MPGCLKGSNKAIKNCLRSIRLLQVFRYSSKCQELPQIKYRMKCGWVAACHQKRGEEGEGKRGERKGERRRRGGEDGRGGGMSTSWGVRRARSGDGWRITRGTAACGRGLGSGPAGPSGLTMRGPRRQLGRWRRGALGGCGEFRRRFQGARGDLPPVGAAGAVSCRPPQYGCHWGVQSGVRVSSCTTHAAAQAMSPSSPRHMAARCPRPGAGMLARMSGVL